MAELNPEQFSLLGDEPITDATADLLGAGRAAEQIAGLLVASRGSTPFTLAVDSGWGTGKSSLMHLVRAGLAQVEDVHTVWYNAWTSTGPDALEGLIKSVLARFDNRVLRRALRQVSERRALVRGARALSTVGAGLLGAAGLVDALWKDLSDSPQARNEMRAAIRGLAEEWARTGGSSPRRLLVVFIDDLDRCSEETVLAVCEAVKIYLDVPGIAFVIGCDRSAMSSSGLLRDLSPAGSAFMEKIFQTSFRIPVPDGAEIEDFVRHCAWKSGIHSLLNADLVSLVAERSGRNPRRVKKLINGFVLEVALNSLWRDFGTQAVESAIRTLLLQHLYPDFYRMLVGGDSDYGDVLTEFLTYRHVRRALRVENADSGDVDVERFFTEHEVRPPSRDNPETWGEALAELESQLPTGFPALAADRGFTSLIEDLRALPQYAELIQRLRQRPASRTSESPEATEAVPFGSGHSVPDAPEPPPPYEPLSGMRILWIDDNPDSVESEAQAMRGAGAIVSVVKDRKTAERRLAEGDTDLLISDITRGKDYEAGFTDVGRLRDDNVYSGPVIFYTGRVTPARQARAEELHALGVTASSGRLQLLVGRAAQRRRSG